jgi:hypothetical protein
MAARDRIGGLLDHVSRENRGITPAVRALAHEESHGRLAIGRDLEGIALGADLSDDLHQVRVHVVREPLPICRLEGEVFGPSLRAQYGSGAGAGRHLGKPAEESRANFLMLLVAALQDGAQAEQLLVRQPDEEIDEDRSLGEDCGFECVRDRLRVVHAQNQRQVLELARGQDFLPACFDGARGYAATLRRQDEGLRPLRYRVNVNRREREPVRGAVELLKRGLSRAPRFAPTVSIGTCARSDWVFFEEV